MRPPPPCAMRISVASRMGIGHSSPDGGDSRFMRFPRAGDSGNRRRTPLRPIPSARPRDARACSVAQRQGIGSAACPRSGRRRPGIPARPAPRSGAAKSAVGRRSRARPAAGRARLPQSQAGRATAAWPARTPPPPAAAQRSVPLADGAAVSVFQSRVARFELSDRARHPFQNVERIESGRHDRHPEARHQRGVFPQAHDGADMTGGEQPLDAALGRRQQHLHRRWHPHVRHQEREVVQSQRLRLMHGQGRGRRRRFESHGEEHHLILGRRCASRTASNGE